jgi:hypothetical protein
VIPHFCVLSATVVPIILVLRATESYKPTGFLSQFAELRATL